jgi:hypothetical protein
VSNRGALGARIRDYAIGYSFDPSSTNDLFRIINNIEQMNSLDWKRELQKLNNCHVTTMTEMIENYDRLYRENNSLFSKIDGEILDTRMKKCVSDIISNKSELLFPYLNFYQSKSMDETKIKNSRFWKVAEKFYKIKGKLSR